MAKDFKKIIEIQVIGKIMIYSNIRSQEQGFIIATIHYKKKSFACFLAHQKVKIQTGSFAFYQKERKTMLTETRNITPEKAVELLKKNGVNVTTAEAESLLEFFYLMANIFVDEIVEK